MGSSNGRGQYISPVDFLQEGVTVEAVVDGWNGRAPHEDYDAQIVELISQSIDRRGVVGNHMKT